MDARLRRWLVANLSLLDRRDPQPIRAVLRGPVLRTGCNRKTSTAFNDDEPGVVPAKSAASCREVGSAKQHQHPGVGNPSRAQQGRQRKGAVPGDLLTEE